VQLVGQAHLEIVSRAAADEPGARPDHAVGAANDLLLVAGQAVGQEEENTAAPLGAGCDAAGHLGAGRPQIAAGDTRRSGTRAESGAAQRRHHDARVAGAARGNLSGRRAADQRHTAGAAVDRIEQYLQVESVRAEDHEQLGVVALQRGCSRGVTCRAGVSIV